MKTFDVTLIDATSVYKYRVESANEFSAALVAKHRHFRQYPYNRETTEVTAVEEIQFPVLNDSI